MTNRKETTQERSARFAAELDEVDAMTGGELLAECRRIAQEGGFRGIVAALALELNAGSIAQRDALIAEIDADLGVVR